MVSVFFGFDSDAIYDVDVYFNHVFDEDWLEDDIVKKMVRDIDNSEVLSKYCIQSPVLGQIPPERLSGGVKTCILLWKQDDFFIDLIMCGENCQGWLSYIFNNKDVRVTMSGFDLTFEGLPIKGVCENDNSEINNSDDWIEKMLSMVMEYKRNVDGGC